MKAKIEQQLTSDKHTIFESNAQAIYIVDYKNLNGGPVCLLETEPTDIKAVDITNANSVPIYFDAFKDNALVKSTGNHSQQCEGVLFPKTENETDWVLFVECKYTYDLKTATNTEYGYPKKAIDQIIETVSFFRDKGILEQNRRATAIIALPNLMEEFNSTFFTGQLSVIDILIQHKIFIRATNSAIIKSSKNIKLIA